MDLAEVLYNLQYVAGFDECIERMKNGDIEGTYAELDFGRMLYLHQIRFRYVVPSGRPGGRNYDVELIYPNGFVVCGDAKCKIETTAFSVKTLDGALEKARSQLPDGQPGIVFVKIPPKWMEIPNFPNISARVARDFLRTTRRVVSVKYYVSDMAFIDGFMRVAHRFQETSNPTTDFGNGQDWDIFRFHDLPPEWNGAPPWWQRIIFYPDGKVR